MLICSNCGKKLESGLVDCPTCMAPGIEFDNDDDKLTGLMQKPWLQALLVAIILVLAIGFVRQLRSRPPSDVATVVETPSAEPSATPSTIKLDPTIIVPNGTNPPPTGTDATGGESPMLPGIIGPDLGPFPVTGTPPPAPMMDPTQNAQDDQSSMPANVRDWLDHLQSIEQERQSLSASQLSASVGLASQAADSADGGGSDYANAAVVMRAAWADLSQRFLDEPAPAECANIRSLYTTTLTGTRQTMLDFMNAMRTARQSPERAVVNLTRIREESDQRIDAPAEATDEAIDSLCARYNSDKWFDIDNQLGAHLVSQLGL